MPGYGDYRERRARYQDASVSFARTAADGSIQPLITGKPKHTIFVQRIHVEITTSAAQSWTFQDSAPTPKPIAAIESSPGAVHFDFDFGAEGVPLTEGANLNLVASGAGLAGVGTVEAYRKATATLVPSEV